MAEGCKCSPQSKLCLKENRMMLLTFSAVVLGIGFGVGLKAMNPPYDVIVWISIWGELFLRMLKLIILPLTLCCLVVGVGSMESKASGKLGALTLGYVYATHLLACFVGILLAVAIKPGAGFGDDLPVGASLRETSYSDVFTDLLRNIVPENIIQACIETAYTRVQLTDQQQIEDFQNDSLVDSSNANFTTTINKTNLSNSTSAIRELVYRDGMNIIGIVVFSLVLGMAISVTGSSGKVLYQLFVSFNDVMLTIMQGIIWYSPLGILSLITTAIYRIDNLLATLQAVGLLVVSVIAGCLIMQLIILPVIMVVVCRRNPFVYFWGMLDGYLACLGPPSSAAALPYLLKSCPDKLHVDRHVTQFVIPILVTINRGGSALFVTSVAVFTAQSYGISLGVGHLIVLGLLSTVLAAAASVVPSASIVVIIMVCAAVGIPVEERIGILMAMEWLLDRFRTTTNVLSHGFACAIIERLFKPKQQTEMINGVTCHDVVSINSESNKMLSAAEQDDDNPSDV